MTQTKCVSGCNGFYPELCKKQLPKSWEELGKIKGFYFILGNYSIMISSNPLNKRCESVLINKYSYGLLYTILTISFI